MKTTLSSYERGQLIGIHSLLSLLVLLILTTLLSCQKVKEKPPDLGNEVSADAINDVFDKVLGEINPFDTKEGDYLFYIVNRKVENQQEFLVIGTLSREVKSIEPLDRGFRMTIHDIDYQYNHDSRQLEKIREEDCVLELTSQIRYSCPSDEPEQVTVASATPFIQKAITQTANELVWVKYYGLETTTGTIAPPDQIRNNPNCSGLTPCQIRLTYIRYDIVAKYQDGSLRRFRVDRSITPDLRYLGPDGIDYETCLSTVYDIDGRPVLVRDCTFLGDLVKTP